MADGIDTAGATAAATRPAGASSLPICVDLDGTLLKLDSLHESAFAAAFADWRVLARLPAWLRVGRARLKQELAARWAFDPATLPYDAALLDYLRAEHARGREIILCTAADRAIADAVGRHLGLFSDIIASDGTTNLRGPAKAEALVRRFGQGGFVYAGNDATDHAVWARAGGAIVVGADAATRRIAAARYHPVMVIDSRGDRRRAALRALRPYQWVKNALCAVPLVASGALGDGAGWLATMAVIAAFCATASAIYLLNDISDLAADRAHARKRRRPFASGALPIATGLAMMPALLAAGALLAWWSGAWLSLAGYACLSLAYNARLKEMPLIDVFILAALYTIRLYGGGQASGHAVSLWLLAFSSFLFLSLALIKRVSELHRLAAAPARLVARRGYTAEDLPILQMFGTAATFASAVVLSLYIQSDTALRAYQRPELLWGAIPLLLFWQCRLWLSTARGYMHDDPIVYAARDWVSWLVAAALAALALGAVAPGWA